MMIALTLQTYMNSILQWNLNGYFAHYEDLKLLEAMYNPFAFLLQETHLKSHNNVGMRSYTIFSNSVDSCRAKGGVAILLKNQFYATPIPLNTTIQAIAIRTVFAGQQITLCSVYCPPNISINRLELETLFHQLPPPYVIGGDFNSHSPMWDLTRLTADTRGKELENVLNQNQSLILMNDGSHTHYNTRGTSAALDLTFVHPKLASEFSWTVSIDRCGSDHSPIILMGSFQNATANIPLRWKN